MKKKVYLAFHGDQWVSRESLTLICVSDTLEDCVDTIGWEFNLATEEKAKLLEYHQLVKGDFSIDIDCVNMNQIIG